MQKQTFDLITTIIILIYSLTRISQQKFVSQRV
jgi:hypothetical protein